VFETGRAGPFEWAVAGQALAGEPVSGDGWMILEVDGQVLVAVVDGLGHGPAAAEAAQRAITIIRQHPAAPLETLFALCDEALAGTRGGAMTLARIDIADGTLSWLGIGNVGAYLVRMGPTQAEVAHAAMLRGGIIGYQLPAPLVARDSTMQPGDLLLIATDGLVSGFEDGADLSIPTGQLVKDILDQCAKPSDDALIMAVRHRGPTR
jgi:negative regulator of sigma-B (phosphoserine phosphatase)